MKTLVSAVFVFVSIAMIHSSANAQRNASKPSLKNLSVSNTTAGESEVISPTSKAEVRALKNFTKNYKNASNVSWFYSGEILVSSFSENNITKRAMYLKNGQWLHTLASYDESQLSGSMRSMVKQSYPKFRITGVTEVHEGDAIAYFINMENDREIKQVIAYEDKVWTHMQYKKG